MNSIAFEANDVERLAPNVSDVTGARVDTSRTTARGRRLPVNFPPLPVSFAGESGQILWSDRPIGWRFAAPERCRAGSCIAVELRVPSEEHGHAGKFVVKTASNGEIYFRLQAGNGETILKSEMYASKTSALIGIESVRKNATDDARYERKTAAGGQFMFNLKAANHQVIGTSET